jgi:hypothetical protein
MGNPVQGEAADRGERRKNTTKSEQSCHPENQGSDICRKKRTAGDELARITNHYLITVFRGVAGQSPAEGVAEDAVGG